VFKHFLNKYDQICVSIYLYIMGIIIPNRNGKSKTKLENHPLAASQKAAEPRTAGKWLIHEEQRSNTAAPA
jgi:hypothetical protein